MAGKLKSKISIPSGLVGTIFWSLVVLASVLLITVMFSLVPVRSVGAAGAPTSWGVNSEVATVFSELQSALPIMTFCFIVGALGAFVRTLISKIEVVEEGLEKEVNFRDATTQSRTLIGGFFGVVTYLAITTGFLSFVLFGTEAAGLKLEIKLTGYLFFSGLAGLLSSEFFSTIHSKIIPRLREKAVETPTNADT